MDMITKKKKNKLNEIRVPTGFSNSKSRRIYEIRGGFPNFGEKNCKKLTRIEEILRTFRDFQKKGKV